MQWKIVKIIIYLLIRDVGYKHAAIHRCQFDWIGGRFEKQSIGKTQQISRV